MAWWVDRSGVTGPPRTWLVVTGTNGKTTTTAMLESIVAAAGRTVAAGGNYGTPVLDILVRTPRVDVLCVEASSFQLHWAPSLVPAAGVVLNVAQDHLDWHGGMAAYSAAKAGALRGRPADRRPLPDTRADQRPGSPARAGRPVGSGPPFPGVLSSSLSRSSPGWRQGRRPPRPSVPLDSKSDWSRTG